jgi:hypothetical protein
MQGIKEFCLSNKNEKRDSRILEDDRDVSGTVFSSTSNLVVTVLGTGMLSMPFAFAMLG